jgi:hypothetical protein
VLYLVWLGWAYLSKKVPHTATMPIATAFKLQNLYRNDLGVSMKDASGSLRISHRKRKMGS